MPKIMEIEKNIATLAQLYWYAEMW